jgi:TonB-dependent receptor
MRKRSLARWRRDRWHARVAACCVLFAGLVPSLAAQPASPARTTTGGVIAGQVTDTGGVPIVGAIVRAGRTPFGQQVGSDGHYRLLLPAGPYSIHVRALGFAPDSFAITIADDTRIARDIRLRQVAAGLVGIVVRGQLTHESTAAAIEQRAAADNIVDVVPAQEIHALPNGNAADAAARASGVTTERVEGESDYIEIRGAQPRQTLVTIDGMPVPGTVQGQRSVKLDDVPEDLVDGIEIHKTLTPDMDANAIGGTANIVTKLPEGAPHGEIGFQYGQTTLLGRAAYEGGFSYGGRVGADKRLGFLVSGAFDQNDLVINDLEPTWTVGQGSVPAVPNQFSYQDDPMHRTRIGGGADIEYRIGDHGLVFLRGLYSHFDDHGTSYQYNIGYGDGFDSGSVGRMGYDTGASMNRLVQRLTPTEHVFGVTAGGDQPVGRGILHYAGSISGTRQDIDDFRTSVFQYAQPITYHFDFTNPNSPSVSVPSSVAANDPSQYLLTGYQSDNERSIASDYAGHVDYQLGGWRIGASFRDEEHVYDNWSYSANYIGAPLPMTNFVANFQDPGFYKAIRAYPLGPVPDEGKVHNFETSNPALFQVVTDPIGNATGSFQGTEDVTAGYLRRDDDLGRAHFTYGLRVEETHGVYVGHVENADSTIGTQRGTQTYTDLFPSAQLRWSLDPKTNLRFAAYRAIGRPDFSDLAPSVNGLVGDPATIVMLGNPDLRPELAWNFDAEYEHFLPAAGVVSANAFYKRVNDFIFTQAIPGYHAPPYNDGLTYRAGQPQNGADGWLAGLELQWSEHLWWLPGALSGIGWSADFTRLQSVATIPSDTLGHTRRTKFPRTSPVLAHLAGLYDRGPVSFRVEWEFQAANITSYGDGTSNAATGDQYFYDHSQLDAEVHLALGHGLDLELEGENLDNAVFGFYVGTPKVHYSFQREFYGPLLELGLRKLF